MKPSTHTVPGYFTTILANYCHSPQLFHTATIRLEKTRIWTVFKTWLRAEFFNRSCKSHRWQIRGRFRSSAFFAHTPYFCGYFLYLLLVCSDRILSHSFPHSIMVETSVYFIKKLAKTFLLTLVLSQSCSCSVQPRSHSGLSMGCHYTDAFAVRLIFMRFHAVAGSWMMNYPPLHNVLRSTLTEASEDFLISSMLILISRVYLK